MAPTLVLRRQTPRRPTAGGRSKDHGRVRRAGHSQHRPAAAELVAHTSHPHLRLCGTLHLFLKLFLNVFGALAMKLPTFSLINPMEIEQYIKQFKM